MIYDITTTKHGFIDFSKMDEESRDFFLMLTDVVRPFRSRFDMPDANLNGCTFAMGKGKDAGTIRFGFMALGDNVVTADIVIRDLQAHPELYLDNMLEAIGQGIEQMDDRVKITVPNERSILGNAIQNSARKIH